MTLLDKITEKVLAQIDDTGFTQSGAFNLRHNGIALCHGDSEHIKIKKKQDKPPFHLTCAICGSLRTCLPDFAEVRLTLLKMPPDM